jgi:4-hydroxy-3-methylbut-2-en-1-yl diphosphate reductase
VKPAVVCTPMAVERAALRMLRAEVVRTGMGSKRSARSAAALRGRPVVVAGVGGGLQPRVKPGDVVVATEVRGPSGPPMACASAPVLAGELRRLGLTVHLGPIVSVEKPATGESRERLAATGALAADMESHWLAPRDGEPFAVVRVISDAPDAPLVHPGIVMRGIRALRALARVAPAIDAWAASLRERQVRLANPRSFCAGVERAIDIVDRALVRFGSPVYVRRQIVHNAHVVSDLEARGAVFVEEADEAPEGSVLVLAAHGVSPAVREQAAARNLSVIDATCPLVAKVHTEVRRYAGRGDTVLLIGHSDHEEVEGTVGEAPGNVVVVGDVESAQRVTVADPSRVAYAMQTTLAVDEADEIAGALSSRFPTLAGPRRDDICYATTNRQQAVRDIAADCDVMLVVGSSNSSNSLRLVEVAERAGAPAVLIDDAGQLNLDFIAGAQRVGITAGASAPPDLVNQLVEAISGLGPARVDEAIAPPEDLHFTLPKEVS